MALVWPSLEYLPGYTDALRRHWSPDNVRGEEAALEHLAEIAADPSAFIASLVDREARGGPIVLADGSTVTRLPGYQKWIWDGEFCGAIGFRWKPGTEELPPTCLGHIGYAVVPWKRGQGHATRALRDLLPEARAEGLRWVEITTDPDNVPSRRAIEANGGVIHDEFVKPASLGGTRSVTYYIRVTYEPNRRDEMSDRRPEPGTCAADNKNGCQTI